MVAALSSTKNNLPDFAFGMLANGNRTAWGYDAARRLTSLDRTAGSGGDIHTAYVYDSAGNVGTITHAVVGGSSLVTFSYAYDSANRLTHKTNAEGSVTYTYDNTNQLTSATGARSESYAYDVNGNRNATGYTVGTGGTLSASPNATYTYDSAGHVTAKTDTATGKVTTFSYDYRDRMTGATRKTSGSVVDYQVTYTYDALNRRIGEKIDADGTGSGAPVQTWTVFDGENPYADFNGSGTLEERYLYGPAVDSLLARTDASGVTDWYLADRLGSVRDIVDVSGNVVYHTGYDSFGNNISTSGTGGDRFGFTGREHDAALNLYYNRARFYDPATGRFLGRDPIGFSAGDMNLYRYVGNGPTDGTDPNGMIDSQYYFDVTIGGLKGIGQGLANNANVITDGIYGVYNLAATATNTVGLTNYQITSPPDWSYQSISYETELGHYYSKLSGSVAQGIGSAFIGNVSTPRLSFPNPFPSLVATPGGSIASGAAIVAFPSISVPIGRVGVGVIGAGRIGDLERRLPKPGGQGSAGRINPGDIKKISQERIIERGLDPEKVKEYFGVGATGNLGRGSGSDDIWIIPVQRGSFDPISTGMTLEELRELFPYLKDLK